MLTVHRAADAAVLADGLAGLLEAPLRDPFTPDVVAVPAQGVERWLAQRLSHRLGATADPDRTPATDGAGLPDGVCANVSFPSPRRLLADVAAQAAPERVQALRAWDPEPLAWQVLSVLDEVLDEPWCRVLRGHLLVRGEAGEPTGRRLTLARHVAGLFHGYGRQRPDLLRRWADGRPVLPDGGLLPPEEQWQPLLWQRLHERLGSSPVTEHVAVCAAVRERADQLVLPERVSVFGASRLAHADLDLLAALAEHRDVHVWLHHASPALWRTVEAAGPVRRRADDTVGATLSNPLLGSLSRDVRELQHLLHAHAPGHVAVLHEGAAPRTGATAVSGTATATGTAHAADSTADLLSRLRADLAADRVPERPLPVDPADRSVQVHACHGRTRQVEVLREVVVGLLADDPTLEPRDVLVMCPDVETFAPLLAAAFATRGHRDPLPGSHPASRLRVRVADRALHQANPLLAVLDRLLDLATARLTATEVLDLAGHPAVARRFGFDDDALERLRDWTAGTGSRWGLHEQHRAQWQLQRVPEGTWRRGVDRLLLGAAVDPGHGEAAVSPAGLVPLDDVDSSDIDLAGRFAELLDRLDTAHTDLSAQHPPERWAELLETVVLRLAEPGADAAWQAVQLREVLAEALLVDDGTSPVPAGGAGAGAAAGPGPVLDLVELRPVLRAGLAGRPSRAGFRTGALTVCTLVPMRSVPHRVVVLLGLDDGTFPRRTVRDGDDLLARDPWVGDRDPRSEDRQLLLDAICAAGEHLVITYTGADERTGTPVPPAVPLGELLDALDRTATAPDGHRLRDWLTTRHPLQPFDARNFVAGALGVTGARPFSFDARAHGGALASRAPRSQATALLSRPLPPNPIGDVALDDLARLLVHPAKGFLRQRLQISLAERDGDPDDALPVELDSLEQWSVGDRMLHDSLAGLEPHLVMAVEQGRGIIPPGPLGGGLLSTIGPRIGRLTAAARPLMAEPADAVDVRVDLGAGALLTGTVTGVHGTTMVRVGYSSLGPKHRLEAWVRLLALTLARPGGTWRAVVVGRGTGGEKDACVTSTLGPVPVDQARTHLLDLVAVYRAGLDRALPLPLKTAEAYAAHRARGRRPHAARQAAERYWRDDRFPAEQSDPEHLLLHGGRVDLQTLLRERSGPDDLVDGWPADEEGDRFGVLARRLWQPLLANEQRGTA